MTQLREILDRLNDIEATMARVEREAPEDYPFATRMTLRSLESRRDMLKEELAEAARLGFVEVCDYRIIPAGGDGYAVSAVTSALHDFQDLVTLVFDAITSKPKRRMPKFDASVVEKTRFDFGFAYQGSLGIVLTIPNERLLAIESDLDLAIRAVFAVLKSDSAQKVREVAERYGIPTVRKLYSWSKTHSAYGMSADIKWIRDGKTRDEVIIQPPDLAEICRVIDGRSEKEIEQVSVTGQLLAWNTVRRTFLLEPQGADTLSGVLSKEFDAQRERRVPGRYRAELIKETIIQYAEDKEDITWILTALNEI